MAQPNIIVICSDEHTRSALGCYGSDIIKSPNLDALARRGARFERAYSTSPLCVPSRASLATGKLVHEIGAWDNGHPYHGVPRGWAHALRDAGWHVTSIGKNHYRSINDDNGFTEELLPMHVRDGIGDLFGMLRKEGAQYPTERVGSPNAETVVRGPAVMAEVAGAGESNHTEYDRLITEEACKWLRNPERRSGKPWALYVSFVSPHFPLMAPEEFYRLYDEDKVPLPVDYEEAARSAHPVVQAMMKMWNYDDFFDSAKLRRAICGYYGLISFLDHNIGRILDAAGATGNLNDMHVVYLSDHGEMLGRKGMWSTSAMFEPSIGVPYILAGPMVSAGRVVNTEVSHIDFAPTMLHLAGLPSKRGWSGRSLVEIAGSPDTERTAFSEYHAGASITGCFAIRRGRWKYTEYVGYSPELYDLEADPNESANLAGNARFADVEKACRGWLREIADPEAVTEAAFADQAETVKRFGGVEKVIARGHPGEHALDRRLGFE